MAPLKRFRHLIKLLIPMVILTFQAHAQFKVIGYYPTYAGGYPNGINSIDLAKLTHVYIAFANPNASGTLIPDYGTNANITTVVNAVHAKGLKVFLSIGGGGASGTNYSSLLNNTTSMNTFVSSITAYANTYNLDGIDVDIEGNILDGSTLTATQYQNFVTALKTSLHANGKLISAALGSWFGNFVTSTAAAQFDWINMMSYDLCGPWTGACQHSPYSMATSDFQYWNSTKGMPSSKLVVGVPFYGYGWGSLYSAGITYCNIVNTYAGSQNNDQVGSGGNVIYYNGIPTIKQKAAYAMNNAAGIMIWELTQDCATSDSRSLLLAISQVLAPLPVTWLSFEATIIEQSVKLSWSTAQEKNNDYFTVESSMDGIVFYELDRVAASLDGSSLSTYSYIDQHPLSETAYYRIKQTDKDGSSSYTSVQLVSFQSTSNEPLEVFPNPCSDGKLHIRLHNIHSMVQLELTDATGTATQSTRLYCENTQLLVWDVKNTSPGIYFLTTILNNKSYRTKVIVQ